MQTIDFVNIFFNVSLLLAAIVPFLYTLHVGNRNRSEANRKTLDELMTLTKKHDKRTRHLRKKFDEHLLEHDAI